MISAGSLVVVTGGAGFIGSALARELLRVGYRVRILDNLLAGLENNVPDDAEFIRGDIRDLEVVRSVCGGAVTVFHQAAFKSVPKSIEDPLSAESCNALGTLNVLLAANEAGVERVIYASSSSVYGAGAGIKVESLPTCPVSPYGVSKLTGEHYCRIWASLAGLSTVCLRYFNVFGPGQRPDSQYAAVLPAFISSMREGRSPAIHGDGEQTRDFTFIDDVVRANLLAMGADDRASGGVMNVCAGSPRTVNELYREVARVMGFTGPPNYTPERPGDIRHSHGEIVRARDLLGWSPISEWRDSIQATVDWFIG